nr:Synerg-CTERM system glutamic-type intramembrane protease MrtS [uncultured Dethiosulfovibrio sp.]
MIPLVVAAVMLYGPYGWCYLRKESPEDYGLLWKFTQKSIADTFIALILTLVPLTFIALNWPEGTLPRQIPIGSLMALMSAGSVAAVVEEVFFRGWLQSLASRMVGPLWAIVAVSVLFALCHLFIKVHWLRLATFFPSLVMGFLKYRHRSVAPSALYHLGGNLWSIWFFPDMI